MKPFTLFVLCLLLPYCAQSKDLYYIRQLSERERIQIYSSLLLDACRHADQFWQDLPGDPPIGCWGSGRSDQMNEGIRAISGMVLASGALLKYSDGLNDAERQHCRERATRAIRYAVSSHVTGTEKCTDGKPWGGSWVISLSACSFGYLPSKCMNDFRFTFIIDKFKTIFFNFGA